MKTFKNKVLSLSLALGMMAIGLNANSLFAGWVCTSSSDPGANNGHCRASNAGNGDSCFSSGMGPACNGVTFIGDPFEPDVPEIEKY